MQPTGWTGSKPYSWFFWHRRQIYRMTGGVKCHTTSGNFSFYIVMKPLVRIFILMLLSQSSLAQLIYETVWVDYDSAMEYKSLQIVPIRPKDMAGKPGPRMMSLS